MKRIIITLLLLVCFAPVVSAQSGQSQPVIYVVEGISGFLQLINANNRLDYLESHKEIKATGGSIEIPFIRHPLSPGLNVQGTNYSWLTYAGTGSLMVENGSSWMSYPTLKFKIAPNTGIHARVAIIGCTSPVPEAYPAITIFQPGNDGSGNLRGFYLSSSSIPAISAGYPGYRYSIDLSGSEPGVEYVLMRNEEDVARLQGTGQPLSFTSDWGAGIFSVVATRGSDSKAMNNSLEMSWLSYVQNGGCAVYAISSPTSSGVFSSIVFPHEGGQRDIVITGYPISDEAYSIAETLLEGLNDKWNSNFHLSNIRYGGYHNDIEAVYLTVEAGPNTSSATLSGTITVGVNPNRPNQTLYVSQEPESVRQTPPTRYDLYVGNPTNIYLSGSEVGTVYKLYSNGEEIRSMDGTGNPLIFGGITEAGPFTAKAFRENQTTDMLVIPFSVAEERLSVQREIIYDINTGGVASVNSTVFDKLGRPVERELKWYNDFDNKTELLGYDEAGYKHRFEETIPDIDGVWAKWEKWKEKVTYSKRVATDYDAAGRPYRERLLLPVELESPIDETDYYDGYLGNRFGENDRRSYTEVAYDNTPQSRVTRESPAGLLHASYANGKADYRMEYGKNTTPDGIKRFILSGTGVSLSGVYPAGTLQKNAVNGPHGQTGAEFRNPEGQLVASREAADHFTHYVYDDLGRLRYVIPPLMDSLFTSGTRTRAELEPLCYWYDYDEEGRVYKKHVPGAGVTTTLYNKRGQVVLHQDARMTAVDSQGKSTWVFTKYDAQGRIAQTGTCMGTEAQHRQALAAQRVFHEKAVYITPDDKIHWVTMGGKTYQGLDPNYGSKSDDAPTLGYTTLAYPTQISEADLLTVNFYDTYEWYEHGAHSFDGAHALGNGHIWSALGMQTGFKERVLGTGEWLTTTFYYDPEGRLRQKISDMQLSGLDVESYLYDANGNLIQTRVRQKFHLLTVVGYDRYYTYDDAGNIQRIEQQIVGDGQNSRVPIATYWYDYQGRLSRKWQNGLSGLYEYTYGVGDMLTLLWGTDLRYVLKRDDAATPRYDGNIGEILSSQTNNTWINSYFTYDDLGRLKTSAEGTTTASYSYDRNGNITSMPGMRAEYGAGQNGNALNVLTKNNVRHAGYAYDANGNMTWDAARGINISYDILNLPSRIGDVAYYYTATGRKVSMSTSGSTTHYQGDVVYHNLQPVSIAHPEGEVRLSTDNIFAIGFDAEYRYFCKDHLGSVRKVLRYNDRWSGMRTEYQSNRYSPFGGLEFEDALSENKKLFTGKELQDSRVGNDILRLYDFGARYYDPTVARWTSIDPFTEMYYSRSPYNYALNNPINLIDPNGLFAQLPYGTSITSKDVSWLVDEVGVSSPWSNVIGYWHDFSNKYYGTSGVGAITNGSDGTKAVPLYLIERLPEDKGCDVVSGLTSAGLAATETSGAYAIYFSNKGAGAFKVADIAKIGKVGGQVVYGVSIISNLRKASKGEITQDHAKFNITVGGIGLLNPPAGIFIGITDAVYPGGFGMAVKDVGQFKMERWESMPWWLKGHTLDVKTYQ